MSGIHTGHHAEQGLPRRVVIALGSAVVILVIVAAWVASRFRTDEVTVWATLVLGIATLALVGITGVLADAANRTIQENRELIRATAVLASEAGKQTDAANRSIEESQKLILTTNRLAEETSRQADATARLGEEVQVNRVLDWRPYLALTTARVVHVSDQLIRVTVKNIGRGPALNCRYYAYCAWIDGGSEVLTQPAERPPINPQPSQENPRREPRWFETTIFQLGSGDTLEDLAHPAPTSVVNQAVDGVATWGFEEFVEVILCKDQFGKKYRFRNDRPTPDTWPCESGASQSGPEPNWVLLIP